MSLLDMGTGDGNFLLSLNHPYNNCYVTEGYIPNYNLCLNKLKPLGIDVKFIDENDILDFKDNMFDLIINRHESFSSDEIFRTLKKGGLFITQQVGSFNNNDLSKQIIPNFKPKFLTNNLKYVIPELQKKGFEILRKAEDFPV